jgi:hypothetical protein
LQVLLSEETIEIAARKLMAAGPRVAANKDERERSSKDRDVNY